LPAIIASLNSGSHVVVNQTFFVMKISTPIMSILLMAVLLFNSPALNAQSKTYREFLSLDIGYSKHGTGDLPGFIVNTEYRKYFHERLFFTAGIAVTVHDGFRDLKYEGLNGQIVDGSIRDATGGAQVSAKVGWDFLQKSQHSLGAMVGPLLRYQTSTIPDALSIYFPGATGGFPFPAIVYEHHSPQRTTSFGGIIQLTYRYYFHSRYSLGATAGFQTDTNGDAIWQLGGSMAIRL
jgi:hypothetical protein